MAEDGSYPWQRSRIDASNTAWMKWSEWTEMFHDRGHDSVRGGYVIPGRYSNGEMQIFDIPNHFSGFPLHKTWEKIFMTTSAIYSGKFDISAMRALDPKPEDMVLIIRPPSEGVTCHNGVTWDQVVKAFTEVNADQGVNARYEFEFSTETPNNYVMLWFSPFHHFKTYISEAHLQKYLATHKDRPFPGVSDPDAMLESLTNLGWKTRPKASVQKRTDRLVYGDPKLDSASLDSEPRPYLSYDQTSSSIPLSAVKILAAKGKRKEMISQNQAMEYNSASTIAQQHFHWQANPANFKGVKHVAEWLHISGFAYGRLDSASKAWESSQYALNMVLGSSETNSMMIRYEKAWQEFFLLEHQLRDLYRDASRELSIGKNLNPVTGELISQVNHRLTVKSFVEQGDGQFKPGETVFDTHPRWPLYFKECPWLCFAMEYRVDMFGKSELFDWHSPSYVTTFYPFTRMFFTKGETMVDIKLLKAAFEQKKAELESFQREVEKKVGDPGPRNNAGTLMKEDKRMQEEITSQKEDKSIQEEITFQERTFSINSAPFSNVAFEERVVFGGQKTSKKGPNVNLERVGRLEDEELEDEDDDQIAAFEKEYSAQAVNNRPAAAVMPGSDSEMDDQMAAFERELGAQSRQNLPTKRIKFRHEESEQSAAFEQKPKAQTSESYPPAQFAALDMELQTELPELLPTASTKPEPESMQYLESQLIIADEFSRLESFNALLDIATVEVRDTLEASPSTIVFEGAASNTEGGRPTLEGDEETHSIEASTFIPSTSKIEMNMPVAATNDDFISEPVNILVVGGVPLTDIKLVLSTGEDAYSDLPVTVRSLDIAATQEGLLLAPKNETNEVALTEAPVLVLSARQRSDIEVLGPALADADALVKDTTQSFQNIGTATMPAFMISGNISGLFGIPFLSATLYTVQNKDPDVPVYEMVKPNMAFLTESPVKTIFPFIDNDIMRYLPFENIQFVYSEDNRNIFHPAGLRVEADLQFKEQLQDIGDALRDLFGPDNIAPTGLHVAAHLSQDSNWNRMPYISALCLQGSFQNMSLGLGQHVKIIKMGVEVSSLKVSDIGEENKWAYGYGFFGTLEIHNLPGTMLMEANYRLRKMGSTYHMAMNLASDEWQNVIGIANFTVRSVQLETSFSTKSIKHSFRLQISAFMLLGDINLYLSGQYPEEESFLEAEIGNLTFAEICQVYAQLMGNSVSEKTNGNDLKFESLYLKVSTNGVVLSGSVTFNGTVSAQAMIFITKDGLGISGSIGNYKIHDTDITIQEAALDIYIGASTKSANDKTAKRASRFGIRGTVNFEGNRVSAGFNINTSATGERQWMLYGAFDGDLRLSAISSEVKGTEMDICLKKAAIIASNFGEGAATVASIDGTLNVMNYPTSKGIQLCALIDPLPTLNKLAKGQTIEGLMLIASFGPEGKLALTVRMPKPFAIKLSETASMSNFGITIEISTLSRIILDGDLMIMMKQQDPLVFRLALFAGMLSAGGSARSLTVWKNPFDISKQVEIHSLGLEIAFSYVTLTPSKLALDGKLAVGDIVGSAAMSVSQMPDQQLISIDISRINVTEIIRFAGKIAQSERLQNLQGGDFLVFTEAKMYFSTGATIAGVPYPAGITASGAMTLFGKTAKFRATVGTSGIGFTGSVNAFKIGPLEVKSASGAPDASLEIAMTTSEQKFLIDGQIKLWELSLKMYINIAISPAVVFKVDVFVGFADTFGFMLKAEAKNVSDFKDLSKASFTLEASLSGDIFGLICDCVVGVLNTIEELGDAGFAAMDKVLQEGVADTNRRLDNIKAEVAEANEQVQLERKRRQKIVDTETAKAQAADNELADLKAQLASAQAMQQTEIDRARERRDQILRERARMIQEKTDEYDEALKKAKEEHDIYENLQWHLEQEMREKYGPIKFQLEEYGKRYTLQEGVLLLQDEKIARAQQQYDECSWFGKPPTYIELLKLQAERAVAKFLLDQLGNGWNSINDTLKLNGFRTLDESIKRGTNDIKKTAGALGQLTREGPAGFMRAMQVDEDQKLANAYRELEAAKQGSKAVIKAIQNAQRQLNINEPRLLSIIVTANETIAQVKESAALAILRTRYDNIVAQESRIAQELEQLRANLDLLHKDFKGGIEDLKDVVEKIKNRMFRITKIGVKIAVGDAKEGKPLTFIVDGKMGEKIYNFSVEWDPRQSAAELYRGIAKKAIAL